MNTHPKGERKVVVCDNRISAPANARSGGISRRKSVSSVAGKRVFQTGCEGIHPLGDPGATLFLTILRLKHLIGDGKGGEDGHFVALEEPDLLLDLVESPVEIRSATLRVLRLGAGSNRVFG